MAFLSILLISFSLIISSCSSNSSFLGSSKKKSNSSKTKVTEIEIEQEKQIINESEIEDVSDETDQTPQTPVAASSVDPNTEYTTKEEGFVVATTKITSPYIYLDLVVEGKSLAAMGTGTYVGNQSLIYPLKKNLKWSIGLTATSTDYDLYWLAIPEDWEAEFGALEHVGSPFSEYTAAEDGFVVFYVTAQPSSRGQTVEISVNGQNVAFNGTFDRVSASSDGARTRIFPIAKDEKWTVTYGGSSSLIDINWIPWKINNYYFGELESRSDANKSYKEATRGFAIMTMNNRWLKGTIQTGKTSGMLTQTDLGPQTLMMPVLEDKTWTAQVKDYSSGEIVTDTPDVILWWRAIKRKY